MLRITFHGAAGSVTGSRHLIETERARVLLDCGMFQGEHDAPTKNRSFPFDPAAIDAVILSHAHTDHAGGLPLLVRNGFRGPILATATTRDLAEQILRDSAHVAAENARVPGALPAAFTPHDIPEVLERFVAVPYARTTNRWHDVAPGVRMRCYDAGHILGSAIIVLEIDQPTGPTRIAFSGDLGAPNMPLLDDPEVPRESVATVLLESTYGANVHPPFAEDVERLAATVRRVVGRGGRIIAPAFALGRTQFLLYLLHELTDQGRIPKIPIVVDAPLATRITHIFDHHPEDFDRETKTDFPGPTHDPLAFPTLTFTENPEDSKALNLRTDPLFIISGSGMMTSGRIIHHLRHAIQDARNAVLITGFQASGTTGKQLLDHATEVVLGGDRMPVRAEVITFNAFSAHADRTQLASWVGKLDGVARVALVHGEDPARNALATDLRTAHPTWDVTIPHEGDVLTIA